MGAAKIDQKRFDAIKIMLESDATIPEVVKFMGVSSWTVSRIKKADTFEEYKNMLAAIALEQRKKKANKPARTSDKEEPAEHAEDCPAPVQPQVVEHRQSVTVQTTYYVSQKLDKMCELLTHISAKLAFVVDELTK